MTFTADNGKFDAKKKVVELCAGESVELGIKDAVHGLDKDGNDYNDYEVKWFKEDVKGTALVTKKCKTDNEDVAPTWTVSYDDVESAGATGVKYIISFHDYFDPTMATTPCDMTDTIIVIANPKPTDKLTDPAPFCEGTLDKEPEKKISGYAIQWFETETDTAKASEIAEPEVVAVTKAESPKSYYYVLTDETTGCRGEANEYVVEVNKAESNTVDNTKKIEYKKTDAKGGSLNPLDKQSPSTFKSALSVKDHTLMVGLVEGATDATAPDMAAAKFGAASSTIPTPTVKDVDSSDDEYLWYYTYLESKDGCLSDTILVGVVIKGAPSPTPKDAAYCVNSKVARPMSEYATPAVEDPNGKLKFYGTDKTTEMDASDLPDVSKPGKYTYWVSQESSTGGGESSKQPIVIEVYGVNEVELSEASHKYCKGETATPLEDIASVKTSSDNYVQNSGWEFFEANEPALNDQAAGAETSMAVKTATAGEYNYYARLKYEVPNSTEVCYGKHVDYTVEVQSVADPITGTVTYLKDEGKSGFKKPTDQTPDAIQGDASCSDCGIVWYRSEDNTTKIDESDATPVYDPNLQGNEEHTYYVKQVNKLGCESNFKPVTIIVSGYPTPTVKNMSVCEGSAKLTGDLKAEANAVSGGASAGDFKLVWYNSKADGTIDEGQEYDKIELSPSIQKAESGSKETTYKYYVLQRLASSTTKPYAQSAPVPVTVTVNANPKLKEVTTAPKCKGESQKLSEMYDIDIQGCDATYYDANQGSMVTMSSDVVTEGGLYEVKGWYVINKGAPEEETCSSAPEDLTVVFHELDAEIVGSDRTCPGVSVDLDADVKVGGGLGKGDVYFSWTNDLNTESGDKESYKTGADGLDAAGDRMKVTLEVSSDACQGARAVRKTHIITVGDGPLVGKISFSEPNNTETKENAVSDNNIVFRSCGGSVEVKLTGIANKDNTTGYELSGQSSGTGAFSSETDGEATLSLGEGKYTLSYINECPTKFEFEISDFSNTASSTNTDMTICEKEKWNAEIIGITGPKPTIEWQRDGDVIPGETNANLQFSAAKPDDSGVYTYTLYSAGCRFDGKIALGNALKVKPYVVLDESSYEKRYEVVNGEDQSISLEFKVPATASDIESDVKWSDMNSGFSQSGAGVTISPVERDYNLHVVAENKEYCKAETDIEILVDARLKMTAELERTEICEGETTKLVVDTTGTGRVLHKELFTLKVTETTKAGDKTISLTPNRSTGKLESEVSPTSDAKYTVTYTYKVGGQDASKDLELTVHEKFQVEFSAVEPVCEGDQATVEVVKLYPSGTDLDWSDNPGGELISGSMSGASFMPAYTASGVAPQKKTYKAIAKNGICQDKPFMFDVYVHKPIDGEIRTADRICQFDELTLDASSYQAETYEWKYEEKDSVFTGMTATLVPDPDYATFTLNMTRGKCSAEVQKYVEVTSAPSVLQVDSIGIRQIEIQMETGLGTGEFKYIIDGNEDDPEIGSNIRDGLSYSEHVVKVVDEVGCSTEFRFVVNNPAIEIPNYISPNGDGVGDKFVVKGLAEGYPDAKVSIFDRWGKELATYNAGDGTDWDGVYNGVTMPSTD
ncbi:MAG: T9SS type B sorting domain-containing protein, partial [Paludibacteraceae bacterium]|nr:T9SS type B sorting domain-containing protein [Paludibacteraceae bacterium]